MVSIRKHSVTQVKREFSIKSLEIYQYSHEFHYGNCWMRVVQLNGHFVWQFRPLSVLFLFEPPQNILDGRRHEKILLLQSEFFSGRCVVVWIQYTRYIFCVLPLLNGGIVIPLVKLLEVKF